MRVYSGMYEEADYPVPIKPDSMKSDVTPPPSSLRDVSLHHAIRLNGKKYASDIRAFDKKLVFCSKLFRASYCFSKHSIHRRALRFLNILK